MIKNVTSPMEWWRNRQEDQAAEKFKERIQDMPKKEKWMLSDVLKELDDVTSPWSAKVPGINQNKEMRLAKEMQNDRDQHPGRGWC